LLLVQYRARFSQSIPVEDTARMLHFTAQMCSTYEQALLKLTTMIERGQTYERIERALGRGACFALGTSLAETHWTKLLPKRTPKFEEVMNVIRRTSVPGLAATFARLQERILAVQLEFLTVPHPFGPPGLPTVPTYSLVSLPQAHTYSGVDDPMCIPGPFDFNFQFHSQ